MSGPIDLADALAVALGTVARAAGPWLARCVDWTGPLPAPRPGGDAELDVLLDAAWRSQSDFERQRTGQVFTPRAVARRLLDELDPDTEGGVLDPACGGGIFLAEAAARRARALGGGEHAARFVLETVVGVDIDPTAVWLTKLMLGVEVARLVDADVLARLPTPIVRCGDATRRATFEGFPPMRWVVGNPPYLEAKRMPISERRRLRASFDVFGAFDLYVCFLLLALDMVGPSGGIGFVLPNKVLVARYAAPLRERLARERRLRTIVDLSAHDVFGQVGVYPVLVVVAPSASTYTAVAADGSRVDVSLALTERVGVWFVPPAGALGRLVERLVLEAPQLAERATARSTVSFHQAGLRERFVRSGPSMPDGLPYLGGQSWSRRTEISPYRVDWQGYRIDYDTETLRSLRNALPPLALFHQPKAILCQHARRGTAVWDAEGRFVSKDVYPVVIPARQDHGPALVAVLNSRVFSTLYAVLFGGIAIGGGYLHFLPLFLHRTPIPGWSARQAVALGRSVLALGDTPAPAEVEGIDRRVSDLYGLDAAERRAVAVFAERLGFS